MNPETKIRKNISLTQDAIELLEINKISNVSGYLVQLIRDNLSNKDHIKKGLVRELNDLQKRFRNINIDLQVNLVDIKPENKVVKSTDL